MSSPNPVADCKCGVLTRLADEPRCPVEFDQQLNEYHLTHHTDIGGGGGHTIIYFCPFCGGQAPKSKRASLFHHLTEAERSRLLKLIKNLRTVQDAIASLGEPDIRCTIGQTTTTQEKADQPEITRSYPSMIYTKLSELADVEATIYPDDKIGFGIRSKPKGPTMLVQQTHSSTNRQPSPQPSGAPVTETEPQIDISKRYDIYCAEPHQRVVVYRNARFKSAASLLPASAARTLGSQYVELEQSDGQGIFVARNSIFRFCETGTTFSGELIPPNR